jgi:hypothetical protein
MIWKGTLETLNRLWWEEEAPKSKEKLLAVDWGYK